MPAGTRKRFTGSGNATADETWRYQQGMRHVDTGWKRQSTAETYPAVFNSLGEIIFAGRNGNSTDQRRAQLIAVAPKMIRLLGRIYQDLGCYCADTNRKSCPVHEVEEILVSLGYLESQGNREGRG